MNLLIVIPARGGSKGIPRKNIRNLAGNPLIYYSIKTSLASKYQPDVYVTSDDDEIISISRKIGAKVIVRESKLATDKVTLDSVIYDAYVRVQEIEGKKYDYVLTVQPTSPLLSSLTLDEAIAKAISKPLIETVISVCDNTHLTWGENADEFVPNYEERLNRQFLPKTYKETGGFFITRSDIITPSNRIGKKIELFQLENGEEIDIDTFEDWNLCEFHLRKRSLLFVLTGNKKVGLGHVYRALQIANDILNHNLIFLLDKDSLLGYELIKKKHYQVYLQTSDNISDDIMNYNPDFVINDILDTSEAYMLGLKEKNIKTVNFEDIGIGSKHANLVINALYPDEHPNDNHYFGHKFFIARDEFLLTENKVVNNTVENVLITFGGTDPNNYTSKVLGSIYDFCLSNKIKIKVLLGLGYTNQDSLSNFKNVEVIENVSNISDFMLNADIIFSSAGRTVYEIACIGTPSIVMSQNKREETHFFANKENGFINLGLGYKLTNKDILNAFVDLYVNKSKRINFSDLMINRDVKSGRRRVIRIINEFINNQ